MIAKNVTNKDMVAAMKNIQARYEHNVIFNRFETKGEQIQFTLRVRSSKCPGAHIAKRWNGSRRTISACWHVHGHFFEELFKINPEAVVISRGGLIKITKDAGNWQDFNVGSIMFPVYASECCECE